MPSKPNLKDIAKKLGVHPSTVSLALRDHPRISEEVRKQVKAAADKMGYQVNPLVAALMQSRRTGRTSGHLVLAYVTNYPTRYGWKPQYHDRPDYFPGAVERAQELGYKLEHFWLREKGMTPERFGEILLARGIHGLLIGRLPPGEQDLVLPWEKFSCVALGMTLRNPVLHRVAEDYYSSAAEAMEQLIQRGYKRIGFVFSDANDSPRVGERWLGAYLQQQLRIARDDRPVPFFFEEARDPARSFQNWFKHEKPDALLVTHAQPVIRWLDGIAVKVPDDIGLATLVNDHPEYGHAGVNGSAEKLGALAVEMLVGLLHRSERGIPADPHEVLLTGDWRDGRTLLAPL
ncbi:MAG: LacI family DNA-binding transcriptional regulator [Nibricoccus sp.]